MKHKEKDNTVKSLRDQIAALFIGLLFLSVLAITVVNELFLERYYISRKAESLLQAMEYLEKLDTAEIEVSRNEWKETFDGVGDRILEDEEIPDDLRQFCSKNNMIWIIITKENETIAHVGDNMRLLRDRLFGYAYDLDFIQTKDKVILETDNYSLQQVHDRFASMDYVEIWGILSNGNYFLIRTPMESIRESAAISNSFYLYVGLAMILFSGCVIWIFTNRITKPIRELTDLSLRMKELDFDATYSSHAGNEIDVLGNSFNQMSEKLKLTISELKTANNELEKDIEKKTQIDEMRKEFLNNVSHELKTPIALIQGYAEGLKDNIMDDPESMEFYCDVIIDESAKMNKLVKNLLTLNHLESGSDTITMERFDITALIQGVLQSMDILIQQKEANVIFDRNQKPVYVWADEFKIEEVLTNYVSNALNHLDGEKQIEIRIHRMEKRVRITVFNNGNPIPEEDLDKLWNKFYKVDKARTREYGGSGIGLSIVKAIMEGLNQEYGVKNYDNGVEFWFTLDTR